MRLTIVAVGRMKAGPETELADRYLDRLRRSGPAVGLELAGVVELAESRGSTVTERKRDEAARIRAAVPDAGAILILDETGKVIGSEDFARRIGTIRDEGRRDLALVIGGPDGLDPALRSEAILSIAFGAMTWPHQIARVLLAEQLYRTTTILSGHPYHRA